jgi:peptidoglycan/xylan/chitin deacetylase (PgdA/CDA1 family)
MKPSVKKYVRSALLRFGLLRLRQWVRSPSLAVLYYHSVAADRNKQMYAVSAGITIEDTDFEKHLQIISNEYHPITLDDAAAWLANERNLPPRSIAVTFDDGFADNYHIAAPLLEKYGMRGTFYLAVDAVCRQELPWYCRLHHLFYQITKKESKNESVILDDIEAKQSWNLSNPGERIAAEQFYARQCVVLDGETLRRHVEKIESLFNYRLDLTSSPKMMTIEQGKELQQRGHIIGSHTFSHGISGLLTQEQLHREITAANDILEKELGTAVEHFSYPHPYQINPQWSEASLAETRKLKYKTAVLTQRGVVTKTSMPLLLPRVRVQNAPEEFRWTLERAFAGI